eukprot:1095006-Lingulodinium_polyedra.AAC.1
MKYLQSTWSALEEVRAACAMGRSRSEQISHADCTTGHHARRCSLPASPKPQSGQASVTANECSSA